MSHHGPRPERALDLPAFCRDGETLTGAQALAGLPRLADGLHRPPDADAAAHWTARGWQRPVAGGEPEIWLELQAEAAVWLQCQRCLQAVALKLEVGRRFRFVRGEDEATALDEASDDDVLALPRRLDLIELLEDELILAQPLVPRHAGSCPEPLPLPTDAVDESAAEPAAHPFAALAALRGRGRP